MSQEAVSNIVLTIANRVDTLLDGLGKVKDGKAKFPGVSSFLGSPSNSSKVVKILAKFGVQIGDQSKPDQLANEFRKLFRCSDGEMGSMSPGQLKTLLELTDAYPGKAGKAVFILDGSGKVSGLEMEINGQTTKSSIKQILSSILEGHPNAIAQQLLKDPAQAKAFFSALKGASGNSGISADFDMVLSLLSGSGEPVDNLSNAADSGLPAFPSSMTGSVELLTLSILIEGAKDATDWVKDFCEYVIKRAAENMVKVAEYQAEKIGENLDVEAFEAKKDNAVALIKVMYQADINEIPSLAKELEALVR